MEFFRCLIVNICDKKDNFILGINCTIAMFSYDIYDKLSFVIHYVFVAAYYSKTSSF